MFPFDGFNKSKKKKRDVLFESIKEISTLSDTVGKVTKALHTKEYEVFLKDKDQVFISLADFLELMNIPNLSLGDITAKCKHVAELNKTSSIVEVYAIAEDNHIVLCKDTTECEKHKNYAGTKLRIVTMKRGN